MSVKFAWLVKKIKNCQIFNLTNMKYNNLLLFLGALVIVLITCKKENSEKNSDFRFLGAKLSDCTSILKKSAAGVQSDSAWYSLKHDTLEIFLGYNTTCCSSYNSSYILRNDTIFIDVLTTKAGDCNCICYNTYDFKFYGLSINYYYNINLDNYKSFKGKIVE